MARARRAVGASGDEVVAAINTTPLVDVMLVLLIIFLITIPVVLNAPAVRLPKERNIPTQTTPQNVVLSVNQDGVMFWNDQVVPNNDVLLERLRVIARQNPQPEVHIRGDAEARYEPLGRIVLACQRMGIVKVAFITEPPPNH